MTDLPSRSGLYKRTTFDVDVEWRNHIYMPIAKHIKAVRAEYTSLYSEISSWPDQKAHTAFHIGLHSILYWDQYNVLLLHIHAYIC